jgi:aldose 1-epimerase
MLKMTVYTDQPGVHIYVGGIVNEVKGKENADYHLSAEYVLKLKISQMLPNHEHFPNAILKIGDVPS